MSSTIRQTPERSAITSTAHRVREQAEQEEAARAIALETTNTNTDNATKNRGSALRVGQLLERATEPTPGASQTEQGRSTSTIGASGAAPLSRTAAVDELAGHQQVHGTAETRLAPASAPRVQFTDRTRAGAESFATNLNTALDKALVYARGRSTNVDASGVRALSTTPTASETASTRATRLTDTSATATTSRGQLSGLGPDELMAQFLKLNINDPNENVETHDKLYSVYTQLRQQGIEDAKKQSENAQKMKKEAEAYAKQAEVIGTVVTVVSIVLTICTFGAAAPAAAAAVAGTQAATTAAVTAAKEVATKAATEAVKTAVKTAVEKAVEQAAKGAAQDAIKTTLMESAKESAKQIVQNMSREAVQQAVQPIIEAAAKEGVQMTVEQATTMLTDQLANEIATQAASQLATEAAAQGASAATQSASQAASSLASDIASNAATTGVQGAVNTTRQFGSELAKQMGNNSMKAVTVGNAALQGVSAGANYKAADKASDAREAMLGVTRARTRADAAQEGVQQEGDVINTIMEHKNQTIDAVMQMSNATWASRQQLMAASVAR